MKYVYYLLIILLATVVSAEAQPFKAKAGFDVALEKVKEADTDTNGDPVPAIEDPELVGVGTIEGNIQAIPIDFNFETGEATVWAYIFRSKSNPQILRAIGVLRILIFTPISIAYNEFDILPFDPENIVDTEDWKIDSDVMVENLASEPLFKSFSESSNGIVLNGCLLYTNFNNPLLEFGVPFWSLFIGNEKQENIACFVNAITGDAICESIANSVGEFSDAGIRLFPNPANQIAYLTIPDELLSVNSSLAVYDIYGNEVFSFDSIVQKGNSNIAIPVSQVASGTYIIKYFDGGSVYTGKIVVGK